MFKTGSEKGKTTNETLSGVITSIFQHFLGSVHVSDAGQPLLILLCPVSIRKWEIQEIGLQDHF